MISMFALEKEQPYIIGNGIVTSIKIVFDKSKLDNNKPIIADMLHQIGVDEKPLISLADLTQTKNGEVWNHLKNLEDFHVLELLLACSDACGFIHNDMNTIQKNIIELESLSPLSSALITMIGRDVIGNDKK